MTIKVVITGTTSSGKSTLVKELQNLGYPIITESARDILGERSHIPLTREEKITREYLIANEHLKRERGFEIANPEAEILFLDRGIHDVAAYCRSVLGYTPEDIERNVRNARYDLVFLLERVPFQQDNIRTERTEEERTQIEDSLRNTYIQYGYKPIYVPKMEVQQRVEFVLERTNKLNNQLRWVA